MINNPVKLVILHDTCSTSLNKVEFELHAIESRIGDRNSAPLFISLVW